MGSSRVVILCLLLNVCTSGGLKFLVSIPFASRSLHMLFTSLNVHLARNGHQVVYITEYAPESNHPNITHVQKAPSPSINSYNVFQLRRTFLLYEWLQESFIDIMRTMWQDERILQLWKSRHSFDALITPSYVHEASFPFLMNFKGTYVAVCTSGVEYTALSHMGNQVPLSVIPSFLSMFSNEMNLWERVLNVLIKYYECILVELAIRNYVQPTLLEYFPGIGDITRFYQRYSLLLINGHYAMDGPMPLLPNQVEIGTINSHKANPLPPYLENFIEGAEEGVILFSLGSIVRTTDIAREIKEVFLESFRRIQQRVIWKYEEDDLDLPSNVITRKWVPQQDILGHPKTRIFISHCGNLGTQEAKYHGVPVLAVPVAFDQPRNAARLARSGFGVVVDWDELSVEKILAAIDTLLNDKSYQERLKNVSRILQDQKESPGERAVWWIEYAIRHQGSPYLESAGKRLTFLQFMMLDVWAILLFALLVIFFFLFITVRFLLRKTFTMSNRKDKVN